MKAILASLLVALFVLAYVTASCTNSADLLSLLDSLERKVASQQGTVNEELSLIKRLRNSIGGGRTCSVNNGGCGAQATCTEANGEVRCKCKAGFSGDGVTCNDINECAVNNGGCSANAVCVNTAGSRTCQCKSGFSGDGVTCGDVNECLVNNGGCSANAVCKNTVGARTCSCKSGFSGDGVTCNDINECAVNNGGCSANAVCKNTAGSRTCTCNSGFTGDGLVCTTAVTTKAPFYRYWNGVEHFYTTNAAEIGTTTPGARGNHNYVSEGVAGKIITAPFSGAVPLYRYWNGVEHFYTTNAAEIGTTTPGARGNHNYVSEGVAGYVFPSQVTGTEPLYRYWNGVEHFYTINAAEIGTTTPGARGNHNYVSEGVAGYVFP